MNLSEEEMNADFGYTYIELKKEYPNWSKDLHENGHILEMSKLKIIFVRGLLLWNIRYCLRSFGLDTFNNNNHYTFYDAMSLIKFCIVIDNIVVDSRLINLLNYRSYQSLMMTDKINQSPSFATYIKRHNLCTPLNVLIDEKQRYTKLFEETSLENQIYQKLIETHIVKFGIVFQRWKIVLEKMYDCRKGKDDEYTKKIYLIDKFLVAVQEIILLDVKLETKMITTYFGCTKIINKKISDYYKPHHKLIYDNIQCSDSLSQPIENPENICQDLLELIESFFKV